MKHCADVLMLIVFGVSAAGQIPTENPGFELVDHSEFGREDKPLPEGLSAFASPALWGAPPAGQEPYVPTRGKVQEFVHYMNGESSTVCDYRLGSLHGGDSKQFVISVDYSGRGLCNNVVVVYRDTDFRWLELGEAHHVDDLTDVLKDIDGDGVPEIVVPTDDSPPAGEAFGEAVWYRIYRWTAAGYTEMPLTTELSPVRQFYEDRLQALNTKLAQKLADPKLNIDPTVGLSNEYFERDKLLRHLGIDPAAGLERAKGWMASGDDRLIAMAELVLQDIAPRVDVSPATAALFAGETQQFTAYVTGAIDTAVTWSLSPSAGAIDANGLYTAPATISGQQTVTVRATSVADTTKTGSAAVTLMPAVASEFVSTPTVTGPAVGNIGVSYSYSASGAVSSLGHSVQYRFNWGDGTDSGWLPEGTTASTHIWSAPNTYTVTVQARCAVDATVVSASSAPILVAITPATPISVSPANAVLHGLQSQLFAANQSATWSISPQIGSITADGLYTAPAAIPDDEPTLTITAVSQADPAKTAQATVKLAKWSKGFNFRSSAAYVTDGPTETYDLCDHDPYLYPLTRMIASEWVSFGWNGKYYFQSRDRYSTLDRRLAGACFVQNWPDMPSDYQFRVDVPAPGQYDIRFANGGQEYAGSSPQIDLLDGDTAVASIGAVSFSAGQWYDATGTVRSSAADWVNNNQPLRVTLTGTVLKLKLNLGAGLSHLQVTQISASAPPAISVVVSPAQAYANIGESLQLTAAVTNTANTGVTWSIAPELGTISAMGLYAAPSTVASTQTVTATAASVADPAKTTTATLTIRPVTVSVSPSAATLSSAQTQQFTATVGNANNTAVTWSVASGEGTASASGLYTAPTTIASQQTAKVRATSQTDPTRYSEATITLIPN